MVYAGVTPQGFPVMLEVNKSCRQVFRAVPGVRVTCTSGIAFGLPDDWAKLAIRNGRFSGTFGLATRPTDDWNTRWRPRAP